MVLPEVIFNKIMLYNSHPVADLFMEELKEEVCYFEQVKKDIVFFSRKNDSTEHYRFPKGYSFYKKYGLI